MIKYYEVGNAIASIERTSSGCFHTIIIEGGRRFEWMFLSELGALKEIISYGEVDADDFEDRAAEVTA